VPEDLSLLDELGLEEETLEWHQLALCKGMDLNLFYKAYEEDEETAKAMDEVCLSCPVMKNCLLDAMGYKDSGLRGAFYLENGKIDKVRNAHKTDEVRLRIQEKLK